MRDQKSTASTRFISTFNGNKDLHFQDPYKGGKSLNTDYKQSMNVTIAPLKVPIKPKNKDDK
jgi:hypothetical protein